LPFSKKSIPSVDVFISLLQVIMMKSSFSLPDLHRTYEKDKGQLGIDGVSQGEINWGYLMNETHEFLSTFET
jgi:hypothetical protein